MSFVMAIDFSPVSIVTLSLSTPQICLAPLFPLYSMYVTCSPIFLSHPSFCNLPFAYPLLSCSMMPVADIRVRYFWTDSCNAIFDARPHVPSYRSKSLHRNFKSDKKCEYCKRIHAVEHGSFTAQHVVGCAWCHSSPHDTCCCISNEMWQKLLPLIELNALLSVILTVKVFCARLWFHSS